MGILDRILKWFRKDLSHEEPKLSVTFNMVGQDYQPHPKRPKRKLIQADPICPYCGFNYETFPKTKKKCPECGEIVIMKSKDKIKRLFTVEQADEYDEEKLERARINGLRGYLSAAGLDPHQLPLIHMNMGKKLVTPSNMKMWWRSFWRRPQRKDDQLEIMTEQCGPILN